MLIRPNMLNDLDALDRRRLVESFLHAARTLADIGPEAIGDNQIPRTLFELDSFEEYQTNFDTSIQYIVPDHGHQAPGTALDIINDDSYYEGWLTWSLEVQVENSSSFLIYAWPVVDGQAIWHCMDWCEVDQLFTFAAAADPIDEPVTYTAFTNGNVTTLGNQAAVAGLNGRSRLGVLVAGIGRFQIVKAQVLSRKGI